MIDHAHMAHALSLAARGLGRVWPNPAVGCVIVKDHRIIGRGWTQAGGRPHAETMALAQAGLQARGATAYVTLEPCAHHGQTPPCADALIAAGITCVVTALTDPDPRVAGQGHARLRAAGIEVIEGIQGAQATRLNAGFLRKITQNLPFVTLKLATSLDGRIATASGQSRWITGPQSRRAVHGLRMRHDAVLIGSGTAIADDPDLGVRDLGSAYQPIRIVIDTNLRHNPHSRLGQTAMVSPVWLLHGGTSATTARAAWAATGAILIETPQQNGHLDLRPALQALAAKGLTRILCEGGSMLAASLIRANLVNDVAIFTAGALIGADGHASLASIGLAALQDAPRASLIETRSIGPDSFSLWSLT